MGGSLVWEDGRGKYERQGRELHTTTTGGYEPLSQCLFFSITHVFKIITGELLIGPYILYVLPSIQVIRLETKSND